MQPENRSQYTCSAAGIPILTKIGIIPYHSPRMITPESMFANRRSVDGDRICKFADHIDREQHRERLKQSRKVSDTMIFDSLVLYDRKRDQTKKERNTKVGSNRSQAEQTTQVAEQNKQKNRSDIVRKPVR